MSNPQNSTNEKHDSCAKMLQELCGTLYKDIMLVVEEIERASYDTGFEAGYARCEKDNNIKRAGNESYANTLNKRII